MDLKRFIKEMQQCEFLIRTDSKREVYWRGYQRGLRRTYYKENFGTSEEHLKILKVLYSKDEKQIAQGYADALQDWGEVGAAQNEVVCLECLTKDEAKTITEEDFLTERDLEDEEKAYFCDRCKQKLGVIILKRKGGER